MEHDSVFPKIVRSSNRVTWCRATNNKTSCVCISMHSRKPTVIQEYDHNVKIRHKKNGNNEWLIFRFNFKQFNDFEIPFVFIRTP